jgi:hypothetical protein
MRSAPVRSSPAAVPAGDGSGPELRGDDEDGSLPGNPYTFRTGQVNDSSIVHVEEAMRS